MRNRFCFIRLEALVFFLMLLAAPCNPNDSPKVWNLSNGNPLFVGREDLIQRMRSFFHTGRILALTGGPGFGKTQIAKRYAQQFYKDYDLVWWMDAQQDLPNQFEKLAGELNRLLPVNEKIIPSKLSKDALVSLVKNTLRVKKIKYLLVFDNAETYAQIEPFIPYTHNQVGKNILITSRNANIWPERLEVGKFKRKESIKLGKKALPKESDKDIENLADILDDYPLGLAIAVAFVKMHPTAHIDKYIEIYLNNRIAGKNGSFISNSSALLDSYSHDVQTALSISLNSIEEKSPESLKALFFMSLLHSKDIPETYIEIWLEKSKSRFNALETIKHLYDQSMIEISRPSNAKENNMDPSLLSLHDLIHQTINERIPAQEKKELIAQAADVMLEVFSGSSEFLVKKIATEPIHLLHARKLCENAQRLSYSSPQLLKLKVCILECLMSGLRDFEAAQPFLEDIEKDLDAGLVLDPYYKALFKINKGFFEASYNTNYDEAIEHINGGLSILEDSQEHKGESLRAVTNLMQYYAVRGDSNKAEEFIKKGNVLFKKSPSIAYNCFFIYACSFVLNDQGKFKEAEEILSKVEAYPSLSTEYQTIEHALLLQKVITFMKQGRLDEAWKLLQECEKKINEFYQGRKNTTLAYIPLCKGLILIYKHQNSDKVFQELSKSLNIFNAFLHGDKKHRSQAQVHLAMGKAYAMTKDYKKALKEYLLSEEIYNAVLKVKKIDDVSDLYKELAVLGAKMNNEEMTRKYLKAHIETFGLAHVRTKEIINYLDDHKAQVF